MAIQKRSLPTSAAPASLLAMLALAAPLVGHFEGKRNLPYWDSAHIRTVCRGHTGSIEERRYTDPECEAIFNVDLTSHAMGAAQCVPGIENKPAIWAASASLSFNIGVKRFCASSAARHFRTGNWRAGCTALGAYQFAGGKRLPGLVRRREAEVKLCLSGL